MQTRWHWHFIFLRGCAALSLFALSAPVWPGLYETGGTGIGGGYAMEASVSWRDTDSKRTLVLPNVEFIVLLNARMEAGIETGYTWLNYSDGPRYDGQRDTETYVKWKLRDDETSSWLPAVAIKPTLMIPTADDDKGLGDGVRQLHLPMAASKQLGRLNIGAEVTYARLFGRDGEDKIYLSTVWQWSLSNTVRIGAELGGDTLADDTGKYHWRGNVGVKCKTSLKLELQGMVGKTIEHRRGEAVEVAKVLAAYRF